MKILATERRAVLEWFFKCLTEVCAEHGAWPGDVLNPKRKHRPLPAIRAELTRVLRLTVGQKPMDGVTRLVVSPKQEFDGHKALSYPALARILGLDHSTLVLGQHRLTLIEDERVSENESS